MALSSSGETLMRNSPAPTSAASGGSSRSRASRMTAPSTQAGGEAHAVIAARAEAQHGPGLRQAAPALRQERQRGAERKLHQRQHGGALRIEIGAQRLVDRDLQRGGARAAAQRQHDGEA